MTLNFKGGLKFDSKWSSNGHHSIKKWSQIGPNGDLLWSPNYLTSLGWHCLFALIFQALSEMQKKGQLSSGADKKTPVSMSPKVNVKKVALTTVTSGKNNPITAITSGKGLSSPVLSLKRPSCTPSPSTQVCII